MFYASRTMPHGHETTTEVIGTAGTLQRRRSARTATALQLATRTACTIARWPTSIERFGDAFQREMAAFVAACQGAAALPLTLHDATEATRIGVAITTSLKSGQVENV